MTSGRRGAAVFFLGVVLASAACVSSDPARRWEGRDPLEELGDHQRAVSTRSEEAQRWFDRGLVLTFAFNHDEAVRCYEQALAADPKLAMAWWGISYARGPHINNSALPDEPAKQAWDALAKAQELAGGASERERALIETLATRYAWPNPTDRRALDVAYADAMRKVWQRYPDDADLGALFAEALMDLSPWNQWTREGAPQPGTEEVVATLARVLELDPRHPLAHHLTIHAWEASQTPERAIASADALMELVPGAGHLVHMPAHTYARVGRWHDSARANAAGAAADEAYAARHKEQGFYRLYMAHNHHFLAWDGMMSGREELALAAAHKLVASMPVEFLQANAAYMDHFQATVHEVLVRFGRWDELLALPEPPDYLPQTRAYHHFTRGLALAALGRTREARDERGRLEALRAQIPEGAVWGLNPPAKIFAVAGHVLDGELAAAEGRDDEAIAALRAAITIEDELAYDEPADWMIPARHTLGAVLLRAREFAEAERCYREDLVRNPENGWALWGLARALEKQGKTAEARAVEQRFERIWSLADLELATSCLCIPVP
ncbi:MAG: tetratricopeptide repeat protein [Planctomycetota bacterium]